MNLSVVIPNYNGKNIIEPLLLDLKRIIEANHYSNTDLEVIISDDGSTDGSVEWLRDNFPWVVIVESNVNTGFGANVNRGVNRASGLYICICNNDISIKDDQIFEKLINILETDPSNFAVMPKVIAVGLGSVVENINWLRSSKGLAWLERAPAVSEIPIDKELVLCGAFFVCRKTDFINLQGFNPIFNPAYWEDVDLGIRANLKGKKIILAEDCEVYHQHSQTISSAFGERWKLKQLLKNQLIICQTHSKYLKIGASARFWYLLRSLKWLIKNDKEIASFYWQAFLKKFES